MSKTERYKRKDASFDTMEMEYDTSNINGVSVINTITIFNPANGEKKLKFYYKNNFIEKIEAFTVGHDVDTSYVGNPTAVYIYTQMGNGYVRCDFKYLRNKFKMYMEGIILFRPEDTEDTSSKLIKSIHYLPDGMNIANIIEWDDTENIYKLIEREMDGTTSKVVLDAKFTQLKEPTGVWKIHAKSLIDNQEIFVELNTILADFNNLVLV